MIKSVKYLFSSDAYILTRKLSVLVSYRVPSFATRPKAALVTVTLAVLLEGRAGEDTTSFKLLMRIIATIIRNIVVIIILNARYKIH